MSGAPEWFSETVDRYGLRLPEGAFDRFRVYFRELVRWNERVNLTAITDEEGVYSKHFLDSLSPAFFWDFAKAGSLADVGSGAGFPGVPLKIVFPHLKVLLVDSLRKRVEFLRHLVEALGLDCVECVHGRAEDVARSAECRDRFDVVTARAVARMAVLTELCVPFVRPGGFFVAMKASGAEEEIREARYSFSELNARLDDVREFRLPPEGAVRRLVLLTKLGATPARYPRQPGVPERRPLVR